MAYALLFAPTDQYFKQLYFPNHIYQLNPPHFNIINQRHTFGPDSGQYEINSITTQLTEFSQIKET